MVSIAIVRNGRNRGAIYARYSSRFQQSIDDQVRVCREWAANNAISVLDEHIFADRAKTGRTHKRDGFSSLLVAMRQDEIDVVITFATNRIYRKVYRSLQFVEEEIIDRGKRCVFVAQNIDTSKSEFWRALLQVFAMLDEVQVQIMGGQVRAAHEGLVRQGRVWGTTSFGYRSVPIESAPARNGKVPKTWAVDEEQAQWVKKIFKWYVEEAMSIEGIARQLNKDNAPLPPKAVLKLWTKTSVRTILTHPRYIGDWSYGRSKGVWMNRAGYTRHFKRDEPLLDWRDARLRIIDDGTFAQAQSRLAGRNYGGGRKKGDRHDRVYISSQLLICEKHPDQVLRVVNAQGTMRCPCCLTDADPAIYSTARRDIVERLLLRRLAELIRADKQVVDLAIAAAQKLIESAGQPDDKRLHELERKRDMIVRSIKFILQNPGDSEADEKDNASVLAEKRSERARLDEEIARLKEINEVPPEVPTASMIRTTCDELANVMESAIDNVDRDVSVRVRRIVHAITGGRIVVTQQGERKPMRGWLRGTFTLNLLKPVLETLKLTSSSEAALTSISIDFKEPRRKRS